MCTCQCFVDIGVKKHWETVHFTGVCLPLCSKTRTGKTWKCKSQNLDRDKQNEKNGNPEGDLQVRWKVLSEISIFPIFFVPVQVLYLPLPFLVPVHVLELQDAENSTGTNNGSASLKTLTGTNK